MTLPTKFNLLNKSILIDLSHVKSVGDEVVSAGGIVTGNVQVSETPTYGTVIAVADGIETIEVGDIIPLPTTGVLRQFEWPGKTKKDKVAIIRLDMIDGVVKP